MSDCLSGPRMLLFGCAPAPLTPTTPLPFTRRKGVLKEIQQRTKPIIPFLSAEAFFIMGSRHSSLINQQVDTSKKTGVLVLSNLGCPAIPPQVFNLDESLRILDLSANKLTGLPPKIATLRSLKSLFLNQNRIQELPDIIDKLSRLEALSVSYNFITVLPHTLPNLTSLRELKLSANRISIFPPEVTRLPCLELLDLSLNQIIELPDRGLENLMTVDLNLNENDLGYLGESLAKAPRLKVLRLQSNHLSLNSIPENLLGESKVSTLLLEGNLFEMKALTQLEGYEQYEERYSAARRKLD